jgi:hypothetical protein
MPFVHSGLDQMDEAVYLSRKIEQRLYKLLLKTAQLESFLKFRKPTGTLTLPFMSKSLILNELPDKPPGGGAGAEERPAGARVRDLPAVDDELTVDRHIRETLAIVVRVGIG